MCRDVWNAYISGTITRTEYIHRLSTSTTRILCSSMSVNISSGHYIRSGCLLTNEAIFWVAHSGCSFLFSDCFSVLVCSYFMCLHITYTCTCETRIKVVRRRNVYEMIHNHPNGYAPMNTTEQYTPTMYILYVIDNTVMNKVWYHYMFEAKLRTDGHITTSIISVLSVINPAMVSAR